jgi:hypothetical protein
MLYIPLYRFITEGVIDVTAPAVGPAFGKFSVDGNLISSVITSSPTIARVQLEYRLANSDDIPWTMLDYTNHPHAGVVLSGAVARGHLYAFRLTATNEEQSCPTDGTYYFINIANVTPLIQPVEVPSVQPSGEGAVYMVVNISTANTMVIIDTSKYKLKPKEYINVRIKDLTKTNLFGLSDNKSVTYKLLNNKLDLPSVTIRQLKLPDNSLAEDLNALRISPQISTYRASSIPANNRIRITNLTNTGLTLSIDANKQKLGPKQSTIINVKDINKTNIIGLANGKFITYKDLGA